MLSEIMLRALNSQIAAEQYSAHLYLGISMGFCEMGLMGFAKWHRIQWIEENGHALKIADYILSKDGNVELEDIKAVDLEWKCPCEAMRAALEHEKLVTSRIKDLMKLAREESDFSTESLCSWFIEEQTEEEAILSEVIKKLEMIDDDSNGLIFMDKKLHEREYDFSLLEKIR